MNTAIDRMSNAQTGNFKSAERRKVDSEKANPKRAGAIVRHEENETGRANQPADPIKQFAELPAIGEELAKRIVDQLNIDTIDSLYKAAYDGRLARVSGIGLKRITKIQAALNPKIQQRETLCRQKRRRPKNTKQLQILNNHPSVAELLSVYAEYRKKAYAGQLDLIAPKYANPQHIAWLPILHTRRGNWHITSLFSNTDRAHVLRKTRDWVVLHCHTTI